MAERLAGTWPLVRLALRRDRVLLPAWILGFAGMAGFSASATVGLYPDESHRVTAAEAVNGSAALVALYGRIYDPNSIGQLSLFKLTAFGAALAAGAAFSVALPADFSPVAAVVDGRAGAAGFPDGAAGVLVTASSARSGPAMSSDSSRGRQ